MHAGYGRDSNDTSSRWPPRSSSGRKHPIAQAILRYAARMGVSVAAGTGVSRRWRGRGRRVSVGDVQMVLGNHRLFEERRLCSDAVHEQLDEFSARGCTPVLVASGGKAVGIIAVADRIRAGRATSICWTRQGIESIVLLTGDNQATAKAIAADVGVDEFRADLLPEDKVAAIADLRRRFGSVAMVGDGVNDAPALASADLGIVMGAAGSDVALETADVALMADELLKIPYALRLSRATLRNIKVNLSISLVMKAAFIVAAAFGVATLWMAILADTGATVIVIANALRLLRAD